MSTPGVAQQERVALCDLLDELGPQAPTLCDGWTTHDLAAHLVTRDTRPDAIPGLLIPGAPERRTHRLEAQTKRAVPYGELVRRIRSGPSPLSPLGVPGLRELVNIHEYFVHHEDVRRANGAGPRPVDERRERALWRRLRAIAPLLLRRVQGIGVELERTGDGTITGLAGSPMVRVRGTASELFLYLFNRKAVADVEISGDADAAVQLVETRLGI